MKTDERNVASLVVAVVGWMVIVGCGDAQPDSSQQPEMTYIDLATQRPVVSAASDDVPATHPETGEKTLMPALYCNECQSWHPAPPLEQLQRNPESRLCPQCLAAMSPDGPRPESGP